MLSFISGNFDMTFPTDVTVPLMKDIRKDAPHAQCTHAADRRQLQPDHQPRLAPFDDKRIRRRWRWRSTERRSSTS